MKREGTGTFRAGEGKEAENRPLAITRKEKKALLRAVMKKAKEDGKTVWDILGDIIFSEEDQQDQLTAIKIYQDAMLAIRANMTGGEFNSFALYFPELYSDKAKETGVRRKLAK